MSESGDQQKSTAPQAADLVDLIWSYCEGTIGDVEMERLNGLLLADPGNREVYTRFMNMIGLLEHELALPEVEAAESIAKWTSELAARMAPINALETQKNNAPRSRNASPSASIGAASGWRQLGLRYKPYLIAVCASLATLFATILVEHARQTSLVPAAAPLAGSAPATEPLSAPIAYLASATGYRWGDDSSHLRIVGSPVNVGDAMTLQEGIAEFRLSNGVQLSLEGPAGVVMASPSSLVLQYGKLTTYVPDSATEFKVMAGVSRLTAQGSAFGVNLAGAETEVHVFAGEVSAANTSFIENHRDLAVDDLQVEKDSAMARPTGVFERVTVTSGESLILKDDNDTVYIQAWGTADETKFTTRLPLAEPLPITNKYVNAVRASGPTGYWRFTAIEGNLIKNDVRNGIDLAVVGKVKLLGNSENRVVELGSSNADGFLTAVKPTDALSHADYSVEVWLRPSHVHAGAVITLAGESQETRDERPGFYLGLHGFGNSQSMSGSHPGVLRYLNRNPPSGDAATGANCYSGNAYQVRRWQHVVAVKQGADTRLYVNGELVAKADGADALASGLRLIIGEASTSQRTYRYCGQLDELSVYEHALSTKDIQQHFNAVHLPHGRNEPSNEKTI